MPYDSLKTELGREPIQVVEIDLDYCANSFGVQAAFEAVGGALAFGSGSRSLAALSSTDVAGYDSSAGTLGAYRFDGSAWAVVTSLLAIGGSATAASMCALDDHTVAVWDSATDTLRTYETDGLAWSAVGSGVALGTFSNIRMASLSASDVAVIDVYNRRLRTYRFGGTTWGAVGSYLVLPAGSMTVAALSSTEVVVFNGNAGTLRSYAFDGAGWAAVGAASTVPTTAAPAVAALGADTLALTGDDLDALLVYRSDGSVWAQSGAATDIGAEASISVAAMTGELLAVSAAGGDTIQAYAYGSLNCTASGTAGTECYNTRATCQDPANYNATTKTYRFCQARSNLPVGVNMIPAIEGSVSHAPTSTTGGKGLGNRAVVKIQLNDHAWHDRDVDPYVATRPYDPETTGTYAGKLLARNPYFEGRELRILNGYLDTPFSWDNFRTEYYDITDMAGPTGGKWLIQGKDILTRTYESKAKYPAASTGELLADITAAAASATLSPTGIGDDEYPASGVLSIGDEVMLFTRSGDTLTLTERGAWRTVADDHSEGDTVQVCATWDAANVLTVLRELLVEGAGIPAAYIPDGAGENWNVELSNWLSSASVTGILLKPEGVESVISELSKQFLFDIWWSAVDQEIRVKALSPEPSGSSPATLSDAYSLLAGSVGVRKDSKARVSEVQVYYGKLDYTEKDEPTNFKALYISTDPNSAGADRYGSDSIMTIYSRWIVLKEQAAQLAGRLLARFVDTPSVVSFAVDIKDEDDIRLSERVILDTAAIQGVTGANEPTAFQVTKITESAIGSTLQVEGLSSSFSGRYCFIAPDGTPDYSAASADQQAAYGFICYDSGVFSDGTEAYKII